MAHRRSCEVQFVAGLPSQDARREFLAMVEKQRGAAARQALENEARQAFYAGRAARER